MQKLIAQKKVQGKAVQKTKKVQMSSQTLDHPYSRAQGIIGNHGILSRCGAGQPLPESVRDFFEPRFGHDLGSIRVHRDSRSSDSANALNARAFTTGNHIVFASGEYRPDTVSGKRLLAHELAHTVQQNDKYEQETDRIAERIMNIPEPEAQLLETDTEGNSELTHVVQHRGNMQIQKADDPSSQATRQDVVVIVGRPSLTIEKKETPEEKEQMRAWRAAAQALAPTVFEGLTVDEAFKGLKQHPTPIGKLYIISHADISGIGEVSPDGTAVSKTVTDMLQRLKAATGDLGENAPLSVDLLSCYGGGSPEVIARIGETLETERIRAPIQETVISGKTIKLIKEGEAPVLLTAREAARISDEDLKGYIRQMDVVKHYDHVPGVPHPAEGLSSDEKLNNLVSIFKRVGMVPFVSYNGPPGDKNSVPYWDAPVEQREKTDEISIEDQLGGRGLIEVVIVEEE